MKFVVLFEDDPAAGADTRRKHLPAHLTFLERHATKVRAAGPLKTSDGHGAGGSGWSTLPISLRSMPWSRRTRSGQPASANRCAFSLGTGSSLTVAG